MKAIVINLRIKHGSKRYVKVMAMAEYLGIDPSTKMFDKMLNKLEDIKAYDLQRRGELFELERQAQEIKTKLITG